MKPLLLIGAAVVAALLLAKRSGSGGSASGWGPSHLATAADIDTDAPPEILTMVNVALSTESDPAWLLRTSETLRPYYPRAAAILATRAAQLKG